MTTSWSYVGLSGDSPSTHAGKRELTSVASGSPAGGRSRADVVVDAGVVESAARDHRPWTRKQQIDLILLLAFATVVIGWRLDRPDRLFFDEKHYVPDALSIWERGVEAQRLAHPPWGKILIGAGTQVFGDTPYGWRIVPAVSGVVIVACSYLATRLLTGRHGVAMFVGALVAMDGLVISMSRIAMLDIIAAAHIMVGLVLVLGDRRYRDQIARTGSMLATPGDEELEPLPAVRSPLRWARLAAALVLGGAVATKWSSVPALVVLGVVALIWDFQRMAPADRRRQRVLVLTKWAVVFVIVPFGAYVATHAAWFANFEDTQTAQESCMSEPCNFGLRDVSTGWVHEQTSKIEFQRRLVISHPYRSDALGWPLMSRPVLYYDERCPETSAECEVPRGRHARILGLGNPVVWWGAVPAVLAGVVNTLRRRGSDVAVVIGVGVSLWAPWIFSINPGFMFYMVPVVPLMAMAIGITISTVRSTRLRRLLYGVVGATAVVAFAYFLPIWTGLPLDEGGVDARILFDRWR